MKNRKHIIFTLAFIIVLSGCDRKINIIEGSFTAINPLSYTDVVYKSTRDTVLISTFSGRIAERVNGQNEERVLINLSDEVYSMAFEPRSHSVYASTLKSGIIKIDIDKGKITDTLPLKSSWISDLHISKNGDILVGRSADGKNYLWNLRNNNAPILLSERLSILSVSGFDEAGCVILRGNGKYTFWNPQKESIEKEMTASGKLVSVDELGNMLLFSDKEFRFYNAFADSVSFRKRHQDWPYYIKEQDTIVRIPLQLSLTVGQLTDEYIFTSGVDRSIRKWSKFDGQHLKDIVEHKATISAIASSPDHSQIVSVDLKGGILFSDINDKAVNKE